VRATGAAGTHRLRRHIPDELFFAHPCAKNGRRHPWPTRPHAPWRYVDGAARQWLQGVWLRRRWGGVTGGARGAPPAVARASWVVG
jgi:hypothetical protein